MTDMNSIGAIVKILEPPKQKVINKILVIKFRAQLPQVRKTRKSRIVRVVICGKLASSFLNYYKVNDSILIEGYVSLRDNKKTLNRNKKPLKNVTISVLKVYPFQLNRNLFITKLS
jgi:hypothetical protein